MIKKIHFFLLFSIFYFLFSFPLSIGAAVLYLKPSKAEYYPGDTFITDVLLNSEGEYVNVVQTSLTFPSEVLEVKDFSKGNSILILWIKEPQFSNEAGNISFIGGVPAGYQGWDGPLGKIIFTAKKQGKAQVQFKESQVLLNDGFGTPAKVASSGADFIILAEREKPSEDEWKRQLEKDKTPPEIFDIEVHQEPAIFAGKYFIIFSTTDKQTGIDRYEIKENQGEWKQGTSPYLLEDQTLEGIITVKAVDKAGNERIVEIQPRYLIPFRKPSPGKFIVLALWLIALLSAAAFFYWIQKKRKTKKPNES